MTSCKLHSFMALSVASTSFSSFLKREVQRKSLPIATLLQPKRRLLNGVVDSLPSHIPLRLSGRIKSMRNIHIREVQRRSLPENTTTWLKPKRSSSLLNATKGVSSVCEPLPPDRPLWFPGSSPPEWLDGSLPGDFGFDPLGLGSDPELLKWFAQAELMHGRWAMLAVAGILIPEWLESLGFIENFSWYDAGAREYFTDPKTLLFVQMVLMGWVEGRRWADILNPGCVDIEPTLPHKTKPKPDVGYPGGLWFDPLMWGRGSPEPVMVLRTKEIKNGRLAMLAFVGFCFQAVYTGQGPIENLVAHIADPGHCNIFSAFTAQ